MLKNVYSYHPDFMPQDCDFCEEPSVVQIYYDVCDYQVPISLCVRHAAQFVENTKHFEPSKM